MIKFCIKYVFQYKVEYGIYFATGIIICLLGTMIPAIMGQFISMFDVKITHKEIESFIILLLCLYVGKECISYFNKMIYIRIQTNAAFSLNFDVIEHLKKVSPIVISKTDLSYLSQRINNDANDVLIFFISSVTELIFSLISTIFILFLIWSMDIKAFIITIILLVLYFIVYVGFKRIIYKRSYDMKEEKSNFFSRLQEQLEKMEFIKIHGMNKFFSERLIKAYQKLYKSVFTQQATVQAFANIEGVIGAVSICVLLWIGGVEIINGNMQIGYFYVISTYFNMILEYGKSIVRYGEEYQEASVSFERIKSILEIREQQNGKIQPKDVNCITICGLNFSYEEKIAIKDFKAEIKKGVLYGVKGENGNGKSTLIKILMGLYIDEYQGQVLWDGIEMRNLDMDYVRKYLLSFTEQEPILIADTIFNNIVLYKDVDEARVELAIDLFNSEVLDKNKWDFMINEKSTNISGGEKQKIAIIRQIVKNSCLMIFDEPTSALDAKSKKQFLELIHREKSNKIIIIISHDNEVLNICDEIIKL